MPTDATAARVAAFEASALTRIDRHLTKLFKQIISEIETPEELFNAARLRRAESLDPVRLHSDISAARQECQAAGIPFAEYDPVLRQAMEVYDDLSRFQTAPRPPALDQLRITETDEPVVLPAGYGLADDAYLDAHRRLSEVQERRKVVTNQLVTFRDASIGAVVPKACLPDIEGVRLLFTRELEQVIQRLRYEPALLFEKDWDYNEGLHGAAVNRLAAPLQRGTVFEYEPLADRRLLRVRHPDQAKLPITWTVWSRGWDHATDVAKDRAAACEGRAKFGDTLDYLRAWVAMASSDARVQAAEVGTGGVDTVKVAPDAQSSTASKEKTPEWIWKCFSRQQQKLLLALWGQQRVAAAELEKHLGYNQKPESAGGNLQRLVTRTNEGLCEKDQDIGSRWTIRERTIDDELHFFLARDAG